VEPPGQVPRHHSNASSSSSGGVEVTLYALNPPDGSPWRRYVERTADHFVDLSKVLIPSPRHHHHDQSSLWID
jgi:hypothetical protein